MAPGGTLFRFPPHFGENVLPHGSHEWLPYSKDEVRLKTVNNNLSAGSVWPMCLNKLFSLFTELTFSAIMNETMQIRRNE